MSQHASPIEAARDARVDLLRGLALLCILVDHVPGNALGVLTLRNFGFADAAELFVLLAGYSSMLAYARVFARDGAGAGLRRVARRCARIYAVQAALLLATLAIVAAWTAHHGIEPIAVRPLLEAGLVGVARGLSLAALPAFLDILPLHIVLLALFPLIQCGLRRSVAVTLAASAAIWAAAGAFGLNMPNLAGAPGRDWWFFSPFAWQFLFVLGAALALPASAATGCI